MGACIMIFGGPFKSTRKNGRFSAWGKVVLGLSMTTSSVQESGAGGLSSLLGQFGVLHHCRCVHYFGRVRQQIQGRLDLCHGRCLSIIVVLYFMKMEQPTGTPSTLLFPILCFFALLGVVLACLFTIRGPFTETGYRNSKCLLLVGPITAIFAAMAARFPAEQQQASG